MKTNNYNNMLREFVNFANSLERPFAYDYASNGGSNGNNGKPTAFTTSLPLDITADENAFTITAYLPGVKPEDVEITMENEELTIRGQFPKVSEEAKFIKRELFHGAFERRLNINVPVNVEGITAAYEQGILTLVVPKAEAIKPKQIKVLAK